MKIYPECIPCLFKQCLTTTRMATQDKQLQLKALKEAAKLMPKLMELPTPTHAGRVVHSIPKVVTGNPDPYKEVKKEHTDLALKLYPELKNLVGNSGDPLLTAIKIAIAGNTIDFGRGELLDVEGEIQRTLSNNFTIMDYDDFKNDLEEVSKILYLADNAGETVFDRILIEELSKPVLYAVKRIPILNDASKGDALMAGIDEVAEIIDTGSDAPGIILEYCSPQFKKLFAESEFIISKGQGNHEALSEVAAPIYFLFKVKCNPAAESLSVQVGDVILKKSRIQKANAVASIIRHPE